jgi:hypothetical protein
MWEEDIEELHQMISFLDSSITSPTIYLPHLHSLNSPRNPHHPPTKILRDLGKFSSTANLSLNKSSLSKVNDHPRSSAKSAGNAYPTKTHFEKATSRSEELLLL